jgi:predicted dehydrogenase
MTLKIAVGGLGHGRSFLRLAEQHPRTEPVAAVDLDTERLQEAAETWNVRTWSSIEEMLAGSDADAVVLALPTPLHAESSIMSLDHGMHVLQEKPLCRNREEAENIHRAIERSGRVFQVGYEVRSSRLHRSIMEHIRREDLGRVTGVWYNQHTLAKRQPGEWRENRSEMGGKLFDCACHYLDLMGQWAGAKPVRLAALGNRLGSTGPCRDELPQSVAIAIEYANGVRGTYNFGECNDFNDDACFGIAGTTGRIKGNPWQPEGAGSYDLRTDRGARCGRIVFDGGMCSRGHLGFTEQFDRFVRTVLDGEPNVCPFEDALVNHRVLEGIDRSLASGKVVDV